MKVKVSELKKGDVFAPEQGAGWTAVGDAVTAAGVATCRVQYTGDGGIGTREWVDPDFELIVERA